MKKRLIIPMFIIVLLNVEGAWAKSQEVAADAVCIKTPKILDRNVINSTTKFTIEACNRSDNNLSIVAAISPYARQTQFSRINGGIVSHDAKRIKLKHKGKHKKYSTTKFEIKLIGLKRDTREINQIPITLVFADGSYLRINAKVEHEYS